MDLEHDPSKPAAKEVCLDARRAIDAEIEQRRGDTAFTQRLRDRHDVEQPLYVRLAR